MDVSGPHEVDVVEEDNDADKGDESTDACHRELSRVDIWRQSENGRGKLLWRISSS